MTHHVRLANNTTLALASTARAVLPPLAWRDSPLGRALANGWASGPPGPFGREVPCDHLTLESGVFISRAGDGTRLQDITYPGPRLTPRDGTALSVETLANALLGRGVLVETAPGGSWRYGTLRGDGDLVVAESPNPSEGTPVVIPADWRAVVVAETAEGWSSPGVPRLPKATAGSRWTSSVSGGVRWFAPLSGGGTVPGPHLAPTIRGGATSTLGALEPTGRALMVETTMSFEGATHWRMVRW